MKATKTNQAGFSVVELVIVLVVLGAVIGIGYVLAQKPSQQTTKTVTTTTAKVSSPKSEVQNVQTDLLGVDIDTTLDTSVIDEALE